MIRPLTIEDCLVRENVDLLMQVLNDIFYDPYEELNYCYEKVDELFAEAREAETEDEEIRYKRSARCFRAVADRLYREIKEESYGYQFIQFVKGIFA